MVKNDDDDFGWPRLHNNGVDLRGGHEERNHQIRDGQFGKAMRESRGEGEDDDDERDGKEDENEDAQSRDFLDLRRRATKNRRSGQSRIIGWGKRRLGRW